MDGFSKAPLDSAKRDCLFRLCQMKWTLFGSFILMLLTQPVFAQPSGTHYLPVETVPVTGEFALAKALGQMDQSYFQPVRFNLPEGVEIAIAQTDGFINAESNLFGLQLGKVYRLRLSNIPFYEGRELYPTLEMLNRMKTPEGRELEFPVQVEITQEDLELALKSCLVTRVVFLENSYNPIPIDSTLPVTRLSFDVNGSINPVSAAEQYGKVMAIFRMGSRIPLEIPAANSPFYFGLPSYMIFK
ncbi:MAG: hypothetical protein Q4C95_05245 [Planctomycetia bacterium]|nr:hypothetical protein [Planctomycetia bacterium]